MSRRTCVTRMPRPRWNTTSSRFPRASESVRVAVESLDHLLKSKPGAVEVGQAIESNLLAAVLVSYSKQMHATLAQLVERLIRNQQVAGSIPAGGSRNH